MAKFVVKKGGWREPFKKTKLVGSIRAACKDARLPAMKARKVVTTVSRAALKFASKRKSVTAAALRGQVLSHLRKADAKAAQSWLRYEARQKRGRARRR